MIGRVKLFVDTKAIKHNIAEFRKLLNPTVKLSLVHKGFSYGTELYKQVEFFRENNVNMLCVAATNEAVCMREAGFEGNILLLSQPLTEEIPYIVEYNLTSGVCYLPFVRKLNEVAKEKTKIAKVHLKVNTGMNRLGVNPNDVKSITGQIRELSNISLEGLYTHFSSSDDNPDYTRYQMEQFEIAKQQAGEIKYIHACNTMGILNFPQAHNTMVRLGTGEYGYLHNPIYYNKIDLHPALSLKTKISFIHMVSKGQPVAYNHSYIAERDTTVAVIPIGYGDALPRNYKGRVYVNGHYANIIGKVCMDLTLLDVTDIPQVAVGDEVVIWDNKNIKIEEYGNNCNSIFAEIFGRLTSRVEKIYI